MDDWIAGAQRITPTNPNRRGSIYRVPAAPWRKVWHTMEAPSNATSGLWSTIPSLIGYIEDHQAPPHLWCWPEKDWVGQTVPLSLSAYALLHPAGTMETNHMHAIQTEILGFARDAPCREHAEWLGRRVLGPVLAAGVPIDALKVARSDDDSSAGVNGSVRFTTGQWASFNGQCGHQNVPNNSHWDPGLADYLRIASAAQGDDVTPQDLKDITAAVRGETQRLAQYVVLGQGNQAFPFKDSDGTASVWAPGTTNPKLLAAIPTIADIDVAALAAAIVAAMPPGSEINQATVEAGVRAVIPEIANGVVAEIAS